MLQNKGCGTIIAEQTGIIAVGIGLPSMQELAVAEGCIAIVIHHNRLPVVSSAGGTVEDNGLAGSSLCVQGAVDQKITVFFKVNGGAGKDIHSIGIYIQIGAAHLIWIAMTPQILTCQVAAINQFDAVISIIGKDDAFRLMQPVSGNTDRPGSAIAYIQAIDGDVKVCGLLIHCVHSAAIDHHIADGYGVGAAVVTVDKNGMACGIVNLDVFDDDLIAAVDIEGILDVVILIAAGTMGEDAIAEVSGTDSRFQIEASPVLGAGGKPGKKDGIGGCSHGSNAAIAVESAAVAKLKLASGLNDEIYIIAV